MGLADMSPDPLFRVRQTPMCTYCSKEPVVFALVQKPPAKAEQAYLCQKHLDEPPSQVHVLSTLPIVR
jgi:hypothetical protein